MTTRERINYLEALESVLEYIDRELRGLCNWERDKEGNYVLDTDGNHVLVEPDPVEESYSYGKYQAYLKIKADVEKLANK